MVRSQDRQGSPALGGEPLRTAPVEEGVVPVVPLLGVAAEQDVHVPVQVEVVGDDSRSGVAGDLHFAGRVETRGAVPIDPGGMAARVAGMVAAQDQVQEPVPVQVGHGRGGVAHRRQDGRVRFVVALGTTPVNEGVPFRGASEGPRLARRRVPVVEVAGDHFQVAVPVQIGYFDAHRNPRRQFRPALVVESQRTVPEDHHLVEGPAEDHVDPTVAIQVADGVLPDASDPEDEAIAVRESLRAAPVEAGGLGSRTPLGEGRVQVTVPVEVGKPGREAAAGPDEGPIGPGVPRAGPPVDGRSRALSVNGRKQEVHVAVPVDVRAGAVAVAAGQQLTPRRLEPPLGAAPVDVRRDPMGGVGRMDEDQVLAAVSVQVSRLDAGRLERGQLGPPLGRVALRPAPIDVRGGFSVRLPAMLREDQFGVAVPVQVLHQAAGGRLCGNRRPPVRAVTVRRPPVDEGRQSRLVGEDQVDVAIPVQVSRRHVRGPHGGQKRLGFHRISLGRPPIDE